MGPLIVLARSELPTEMDGLKELERRLFSGDGAPEFRFDINDDFPKLAIRRGGRYLLPRWGNTRGQSRALPATAFVPEQEIKAGAWARYGPEEVEIAATFWVHGGVWIFVKEGIRGILVPDEAERAVCYVRQEKANNYYKNMTGADWMPLLVNQVY